MGIQAWLPPFSRILDLAPDMDLDLGLGPGKSLLKCRQGNGHQEYRRAEYSPYPYWVTK